MANASAVVGNDTGPTHLAAALGVPTVALFSADSDPALTRPRRRRDGAGRRPTWQTCPVQRVAAALPQVHSPISTPLEAL